MVGLCSEIFQMENISNLLICPITLQIFHEPVTLSDGRTYEKSAAIELLKHTKISPITRKELDDDYNNLHLNYTIKSIIEKYILDGTINESDIFNYIAPKCVIELIQSYGHIYKSMEDFIHLNHNDEKLLKKLIDDLEKINKLEIEYNDNYKLIHYIFRYSNFEIIKYIVDKGVDLESKLNNEWKPIHFACRYSNFEIIKYIIDKGVNLESKSNDGWKPIHFACRYSNFEIVKYIVDKGVDLESKSNDGLKPIHIACRCSNFEIIKYIVDKGVDLESKFDDGWKPIHIACKYSTPDVIKYLINKGVVLESLSPNGYTLIELAFEYSTPEIIKCIIEKGVKVDYFNGKNIFKKLLFINSFCKI